MKDALIVRPEAEADLAAACRWYEERSEGLGHDFLLSVEVAIEAICQNPALCPRIHKAVRRKMIRRFPFGVFYVSEENRITVLAVMHCRRSPDEWMKRVTKTS